MKLRQDGYLRRFADIVFVTSVDRRIYLTNAKREQSVSCNLIN